MRTMLSLLAGGLLALAVSLPAADAAGSVPTVVTGVASGVTERTAALAGTVTPNGSPTSFRFEYGTSAGYGSMTPMRRAGAGSSAETVAAYLFHLTPATVYHFRLDATNAAGTSEGSDATFTTSAGSVPTVVTGVASGVTERTAALAGTVTPNGSPTSFRFEYGTSAGYGSMTPMRRAGAGSSAETVAAYLFHLTPATVYHFRLDATNAAGTSEGSDATFTTSAGSVPTVVTGVASGVTERTAALAGTVTPNGSPTSFRFEYGTSAGYGSMTPMRRAGAGSSAETVAAYLFHLTPATVYHFRLDATNAAGTSEGSDATFTTSAGSVPTVVTGVASGVTERTAALAGTVTPNGSPTSFRFEYGTSAGYGSMTPMRRAGAGSSAETVAAYLFHLTPATVYHFRLDATNAAGTSEGSDATFTTSAGSVPTVVTGVASGVTERTAALAGTVTPNGSPTSFRFEYGTSAGYGSMTPMRRAGAGSSAETVAAYLFHLTPATVYHFRLDATNAAGTSEGSDATFTTQPSTVLPHHQWFAGSVSAVGSNSLTVNVSWTGPHDGSLNGQTLTVAVVTGTRISRGPHHTPIALAQVHTNDLVSLDAVGTSPTALTATRIHVSCNCHWVGGTIGAIDPTGGSFSVHVTRTGPFDSVLEGQNVTMQVNADTVYLRGPHQRRIAFSDLKLGQGVGVVFGANGFFRSPSFDPSKATYTASRVHVWGPRSVPDPSTDASEAAQTSVSG